jgi:hypothetical protein
VGEIKFHASAILFDAQQQNIDVLCGAGFDGQFDLSLSPVTSDGVLLTTGGRIAEKV